jgi:tripartite-type tricarboxylate transporter receptor subunit TctC
MIGIRVLLAVAALWTLAAAVPARAAEDFYKGQQIKIYVGQEAGGSYDAYARLMQRHFGRFVSGNPTIVVLNQPGAGSIPLANSVYSAFPQDGTVIGALLREAPFEQVFGNDAVKFDALKFQWLGSLNEEPAIAVTMVPAKARTFDDLRSTEAIFGSSGANSGEIFPSMLTNMMGSKIKLVGGYPSLVQVVIAMERGEVEGVAQSWQPFKVRYANWLAEKRINLLVQFALAKQPDLPDVPLIMDLLTEKYLLPEFKPAEAELLWRLMLTQQSMARPFVLGPGVPADRMAILRKAFDTMVKDKDFLADADKAKIPLTIDSGEDLKVMIAKVAAAPRAAVDRLRVVSKPK